jgi:hypothetical protein
MDIQPGDVVTIRGSKEQYTVIESDGGGYRIQDTHGNEVWVPAHKIVDKKNPPKPRTSRRTPNRNSTEEIPVVADAFIAHLRESCFINGGGRERDRAPFERRYEEATGHTLNGQAQHMSWTNPEKTFTYSLRVSFPAPSDKSILPSGVHLLDRCKNRYVFRSNAFVFDLLSQGFDLGQNGRE